MSQSSHQRNHRKLHRSSQLIKLVTLIQRSILYPNITRRPVKIAHVKLGNLYHYRSAFTRTALSCTPGHSDLPFWGVCLSVCWTPFIVIPSRWTCRQTIPSRWPAEHHCSSRLLVVQVAYEESVQLKCAWWHDNSGNALRKQKGHRISREIRHWAERMAIPVDGRVESIDVGIWRLAVCSSSEAISRTWSAVRR